MRNTLLFISAITLLTISCKKDKNVTPVTDNKTSQPSKLGLLCTDWILFETYEDDVQKSTNGTGKYRFSVNGNFDFYDNSNGWKNIATYHFNDKDSNSISVLFSGTSMSYWWDIKTLNKTDLKTEFMINGTKFNYNYTK